MTDERDPDGQLATVHHLPAPSGEVVDAELVDEAEYERLTTQRGQALERWRGYRQDATTVARTVVVVVTHRRTRAAGRTVLRHLLYIAAGARVLGKRWWEAKTNSRYERLMRAAEAAGDHEKLLEWEARSETARERRHKRRMDWLRTPFVLAKTFALAAVMVLVGLLFLGLVLFAASKDAHQILVPITALFDVILWLTWAFAVAWAPLMLAAPWVLGLVLWQVGRRNTTLSPTLAPTVDEGTDPRAMIPSTGAILDALRHLAIPQLNAAFKEGWASPGWPTRVWINDPHRDGKGWRAQLALPQGVTVEMIARREKRAVLAHNLKRMAVEVWPTEPKEHPGVLDLWIADQGSLTGPVPAWPLLASLDTAETDYFAGVPAGMNIRGDVVNGRLFECNYVIGGIMGSGKSTLVIDLILGAMLDPIVDIDVRVLAENADYEPMRPRLRSLETGADKATVRSCLDLLAEAYEDVQCRGKALKEHDERANSRKLALKDSRLRPRVIVIDECQALFMDEKLGEQAADQAITLQSAARKYGVTIIYLTPEPTKDSLPRKLVATASHKACFAIGDQTSNDAVLGTGSYKSGVSAVGLEPKTDEGLGDVGTAMTRGFSAKPSLLRCFYVPQSDAHRVTQRSLQIQAGSSPTLEAGPAAEKRDILVDVIQLMAGKPRVRSALMLQWLAKEWPAAYEGWAPQKFAEALRVAGVTIRLGRTDGKAAQRFISLDDLLDAQDRRSVEDEVEHTEEDGGDEG